MSKVDIDPAFNDSDELFDSSFSFMNTTDSTMEYYLASPEGAKSPESSTSQQPQQQQQQQHGESAEASNQFSLSPLTMNEPIHAVDLSAAAYPYPPYALTYDQQNSSMGHSSSLYHPYRGPGGDFTGRSPRSPHSPNSIDGSPHGSLNSNRLSFGAPTAVSPSLVSPQSLVGSVPNDSPTGAYPPPGYPYQFYAGTPLSGMSDLSNVSPTGPGLSMVSGFPYPTSSFMGGSPSKSGAVRTLRNRDRGSKSRRVKEEDLLSDDEDEEGPRGLGLSNSDDDRVPVSNKREDVRKARIESEQRRRDELREGFKRLKEALPQTNQRASKSSLLDRSVAHIQAIESANRFLLTQLEDQNKECIKLREILHNEVLTRPSSNSPQEQQTQRLH
ncbi:hypothetical protein I350_06323 [Cryptococcus amylolentus CBS 6273]|uniref:BHLH domain-containing protein n=1 Tax=Cryptococcus amylolentus CBS 6273 TaxID=1296118 RepID=A0A1E3JL12_9TREE|nr:hypothetical protein I350_06323 [Cryptococcus amylolentus CBS 6273]